MPPVGHRPARYAHCRRPMLNEAHKRKLVRNAVEFHRQGKLAAAEELYRSVLAQHPEQFEALHFLGLLRMQQNRPAEALPLLERALSIDPHSADDLSIIAGALLSLGRPTEALAKLDALLAIRPADAAAHYNRGVVLSALSRPDEAAASYRETLSLAPNNVAALSISATSSPVSETTPKRFAVMTKS